MRFRVPRPGCLVMLCVPAVGLAIGLALLMPYYGQWRAARAIQRLGGAVEARLGSAATIWRYLGPAIGSAFAEVDSVSAGPETDGAAVLAHVGRLRWLQSLELPQAAIEDAGLASLRGHSNLTVLRLPQTPVGDAGLAHVATRSCLTNRPNRDW